MICENCGSNHDGSYGSGRFCSSKCARSFSTKKDREAINQKVSKTLGGKNYKSKERHCLYCGINLNWIQKKFCSINCQQKYNYHIFINKWLLGLEQGLTKNYEVSKHIHKYLRKKYENSCQKCGWSEVHSITEKVPLVIHHINGNCCDNTCTNLELLCPNCHSLTDNFGVLNNSNVLTRQERLLKTKKE